jgi:hypothetical protein
MQLNQSRLHDLFAQELRRSALTDFSRICARFTPRFAQKSASQPRPSQLHGYGLRNCEAFRSPKLNHARFDGELNNAFGLALAPGAIDARNEIAER